MTAQGGHNTRTMVRLSVERTDVYDPRVGEHRPLWVGLLSWNGQLTRSQTVRGGKKRATRFEGETLGEVFTQVAALVASQEEAILVDIERVKDAE